MTTHNFLSGQRILVVEDDFFICDEMVSAFEQHGATTIGPVSTVEQACELVGATAGIDGAVLDINLHGDMSFPVADMLVARKIPFVFATGYDENAVPRDFAKIPRCEKPVDPEAVAFALFGEQP